MKNTRLPALLLALLLLTFPLIGCGGKALKIEPALPAAEGKSGKIEPNKPTQTEAPAETETPAQEETPAQAETPTQTETPAQAEVPPQTEAPAQAEAPTQPETPAQPEPQPEPEPEPEIYAPVPEVPLESPELYTAPPAKAEVYNPSANHKEFRVIGAANSDGDYAVLYGECAHGALITCETADGDFSVQSFGGCFALRVKTRANTLSATLTQSYEGEVIGDPVTFAGSVKPSSWVNDPNWCALIGGGNQGFFRKMLPDFQRTNLLDDATIQAVKEKYASRVETAKGIGDGCEIIALLIPASMTVYPELVPEEYPEGEGESRMDQAVKLLREAGVTVLDERETFLAHRNDSLPLYYKYDSHWADYGSYLAYVDLFDYISDRYPDAAPRKFDEFSWEWNWYTGGDMPFYFDVDQGGSVFELTYVRKMKFTDELPAPLKALKRYTNPASVAYASYSDEIKNGTSYNTMRANLPDLYIFRNSYSASIFDILAERCDKCDFQTMFTYTWNIAQIKRAAPDYIVYIVTEWELENIFDN